MANVQIKSEKLTPFGGIFSIMEQFDLSLIHIFFQFQADQVGHTAGIVAAIGFDHDTGRNDAVFHQVVGDTGELSLSLIHI